MGLDLLNFHRIIFFLFPIIMELVFLGGIILFNWKKEQEDITLSEKLKIFFTYQSLAILYYPLSYLFYLDFMKVLEIFNITIVILFFISLVLLSSILWAVFLKSKLALRELIRTKAGKKYRNLSLWVLFIILIIPIILYL